MGEGGNDKTWTARVYVLHEQDLEYQRHIALWLTEMTRLGGFQVYYLSTMMTGQFEWVHWLTKLSDEDGKHNYLLPVSQGWTPACLRHGEGYASLEMMNDMGHGL